MSKFNLLILDAKQSWQVRLEQPLAAAVIASLSADPTRLVELHAALERFMHSTWRQQVVRSGDYATTEFHRMTLSNRDAVIDLVGQSAWTRWDQADCPLRVRYLDTHGADSRWLDYDLSKRWQWLPTLTHEAIAQHRDRIDQLIDVRTIVYGRPLFDHLVRCRRHLVDAEIACRCRRRWPWKHWPAGEAPFAWVSDDTQFEEPALAARIRLILHSWWSHVPATCQRSVKELLLEDQIHLDTDLRDRAIQAMQLGRMPQGLATDAHAYHCAGLGPNELAAYYRLITLLVRQYCCRRVSGSVAQPPSIGEDMVWLQGKFAEHWQRSAAAEWSVSLAEVINRERRRVPLLQAMWAPGDGECPLCAVFGGPLQRKAMYVQFTPIDDDRFPFPYYIGDERFLCQRTLLADVRHHLPTARRTSETRECRTSLGRPGSFAAQRSIENDDAGTQWISQVQDGRPACTASAPAESEWNVRCVAGDASPPGSANRDRAPRLEGDTDDAQETMPTMADVTSLVQMDKSLESSNSQRAVDAAKRSPPLAVGPTPRDRGQNLEVDLFHFVLGVAELLAPSLEHDAAESLAGPLCRRLEEFAFALRHPQRASLSNAAQRLGQQLEAWEQVFPKPKSAVRSLQTRMIQMQQRWGTADGDGQSVRGPGGKWVFK